MFAVRPSHNEGISPALSLAEFVELVRQPYSQPTVASLLDAWFGYGISGSHETTEIRSLTGQSIDLETLYGTIQSDAAYWATLRDAALRLRN